MSNKRVRNANGLLQWHSDFYTLLRTWQPSGLQGLPLRLAEFFNTSDGRMKFEVGQDFAKGPWEISNAVEWLDGLERLELYGRVTSISLRLADLPLLNENLPWQQCRDSNWSANAGLDKRQSIDHLQATDWRLERRCCLIAVLISQFGALATGTVQLLSI